MVLVMYNALISYGRDEGVEVFTGIVHVVLASCGNEFYYYWTRQLFTSGLGVVSKEFLEADVGKRVL